eukprot:50745-Pleurochrysis_carterae.AAC.1
MIPQRVYNHPWPIQFAAQPPPEGEAPREEQVYARGQRHLDCLLDPYIDHTAASTGSTLCAGVAEQACQEAGGAAVEAIAFHVHPSAQNCRRHPGVEALNLPLQIPTEQLSGCARHVVNNGMGLVVMDMQAKALSEEISKFQEARCTTRSGCRHSRSSHGTGACPSLPRHQLPQLENPRQSRRLEIQARFCLRQLQRHPSQSHHHGRQTDPSQRADSFR